MTGPAALDSSLLQCMVATIGELPTSPAVVSTVMGLTRDLNTGPDKLSHALSADPALAAKVLRLSNSPFYGQARSVSSLKQAIMILGFDTIRSLAVATSAHSMFKRSGSGEMEHRLWRHSLAVAICARITARQLKSQSTEEMFLAGLLHDIGVLILLQKKAQTYEAILQSTRDTELRQLTEEKRTFGFTHEDLGGLILERWNFPALLFNAVRHHNNPETAASDAVDPEGINAIETAAHFVCFADNMATTLDYALGNEREIDLMELPSVAFLNLSAEHVGRIASELAERFAEEEHLFEG